MFNLAKQLLLSNNVLIHFDPTLDLLLSCDTSEYGISAILAHCLPDASERPIGFVSRTLSEAECSSSLIESKGDIVLRVWSQTILLVPLWSPVHPNY